MSPELTQLKKQNRLLKIGIAVSALFFIFVAMDSQKARFKEIDVERINVVTPDGKREMVISNRKLFPRAIMAGGVESKNVRNTPGILFYNDLGEECGGLSYHGKLDEEGNPVSGTHLAMDRFGGDQLLALGHYEANGFMETGLYMFDRGLYKNWGPLWEAFDKATDADEKKALMKKIDEVGGRQIQRAFFGKTRGESSAVILADAKGMPRILMYVTPEGQPVLQFIGDSGEPIYSLPPTEDAETD